MKRKIIFFLSFFFCFSSFCFSYEPVFVGEMLDIISNSPLLVSTIKASGLSVDQFGNLEYEEIVTRLAIQKIYSRQMQFKPYSMALDVGMLQIFLEECPVSFIDDPGDIAAYLIMEAPEYGQGILIVAYKMGDLFIYRALTVLGTVN